MSSLYHASWAEKARYRGVVLEYARALPIKNSEHTDLWRVRDFEDYTLDPPHVVYEGKNQHLAEAEFIHCCETSLQHAIEEGRA